MKTYKIFAAFFLAISLFALPVHADVAVIEAEGVDDERETGVTASIVDDGKATVKPDRSNETHLDLGEETDDDDLKVKIKD